MLRFRVGPFPVTVSPSFFLAALILGLDLGIGWQLLVWIGVVFFSVLVHELGHAAVGRMLGGEPEIRLQGFGGVTFPGLRQAPSALKQIALSLAGPFAGFALGFAAKGLTLALPPQPGSPVELVMGQVMFASFVWGFFNLVPVWPLDGGKIFQSAIEGVRKKPSDGISAWFSIVVAGGLAVFAYFQGQIYLALWGLLFVGQNWQRLRPGARARAAPQAARVDPFERADAEAALAAARKAVAERDYEAALAAADALEHKGGSFRQAAGLRLKAGVELSRGDNEAAAMFAGQSFSVFQTSDAAVVAARANLRKGEQERARNWLRRAEETGVDVRALRGDPELGALA